MTEVGPLVMQLYDKTIYTYPVGAKALGWCLALSSVMMVPLVAIKTIIGIPGSISQVMNKQGFLPFDILLSSIRCIIVY